MVVDPEDLYLFNSADFDLQINGIEAEDPRSFNVKPMFQDDLALIETLKGERGFSFNDLSTKGEVEIVLSQMSPTNDILEQYADNRTPFSVFVVASRNPERYPVKKWGFAFAMLKPAEHKIEKQEGDRSYTAIAYGYRAER